MFWFNFRWFLILFMANFLSGIAAAQKKSEQEIKQQIDSLYKTEKIIEINNLISQNTFLSPQYSLAIIDQNIKIAQQKENKDELLASTYITMGSFWARNGNKTKSYESYVKSENHSRSSKDLRRLGMALMGQANILENLSQQIVKYEEVIEILKEQKDSLNLIRTYLNYGYAISSHINNNNQLSEIEKINLKNEIEKKYQLAENLNEKFQNSEMNALLNYRKGELEMDNENFAKASLLFEKAKIEFAKIGQMQWEVFCTISLAQSHLKSGSQQKALELLYESERICKQYEFNDQLIFIYQLLSETLSESGNLEKAYLYSNLYNQLFITQSEKNNQDKIKSLRLEQEISKNQLVINNFEIERRTHFILIGFSLLAIVLISGLFYSMNQNKKKKIANIEKDKIITEIKLKNQELQEALLREKVKFNQEHLINFANQVENIDAFLDQIKSKLKKISVNQQTQNEINELKLSFTDLISDQNQLKKINSLNSENNQDFFLEIRKKHANLTASEEQLLSFLIRDMTSKEIADILKITTESVHKKRYRLRKKLDLKPDESFLDFYNKSIGN